MKKLLKKGVGLSVLSAFVLSAFVLSPTVSDAQLNVDLTSDLNGIVGSAMIANVDANANIDTSVNTNSGINLGTGVDGNVEVYLNDSVDADTQTESDSSVLLRINSSGIAVTSSAQVSSEADLEVFSSNISVRDDDVARVKIESDNSNELEVKVVYKHKGRLLGFVPVTIKSTTVVEAKADAEAEVRSRMSWWGFLVAKKNYAKADLESRIKNNATVQANANVNASAAAKAQIAEAVIAEVEANAKAQAAVNVSR